MESGVYSFMYLLSFSLYLVFCGTNALALREAINQGIMGRNCRPAEPRVRGSGVAGSRSNHMYSRESLRMDEVPG